LAKGRIAHRHSTRTSVRVTLRVLAPLAAANTLVRRARWAGEQHAAPGRVQTVIRVGASRLAGICFFSKLSPPVGDQRPHRVCMINVADTSPRRKRRFDSFSRFCAARLRARATQTDTRTQTTIMDRIYARRAGNAVQKRCRL